MSITIAIPNDTNQSLGHDYGCNCVEAQLWYAEQDGLPTDNIKPNADCGECNGTGKVSFRYSRWQLNMTNSNFAAIMGSLGYTDLDCYGDIDPSEVLVALDNFSNPEKAARETWDTNDDPFHTGCRTIHCGLSRESVDIRYEKLREICEETVRRGELICWG